MPDPIPNSVSMAYPALVAELSKDVPGTVGEAERSYFTSAIDAAQARDDGAEVQSAAVLDAALGVLRAVAPSVVARKLAGYGVLRLRNLLDLCADLAGKVAALDGAIVGAAGAGANKTTSLTGSRQNRRAALRVLRNLAGSDAEAHARLRQAAKDRERPDERSRSLERLAQEVEAAIARVPASIAADAGATPELVTNLRTYATGVLGAAGSAHGARVDVGAMYDAMNVLDGRIMKEIQLLVGSARDARRADKTVPATRNPFRSKGKKRPPETPPQPAPAA